MPNPILFVVDDELDSLRKVERELVRRYGADYDVLTETSAPVALQRLEALAMDGREVVVVFADLELPGMHGADFLMRIHDLMTEAKRALLVDLGNISCAGTLLQALTFGQADNYITKPFETPDEQFHRAISELLEEWARIHRQQFELVRIVGEQWSPRSYELRDALTRSGIPGAFYDVNSDEGRDLLKAVDQLPPSKLPVCVLYNAEVLIDPSFVEFDEAIGVSTHPEDKLYDLAIVGAGPAGLSAAVYGASEGLDTVVVERDTPGGQAGTSSLVRNYLGFPRGISGSDLMMQAYRQAWLFQAKFVFARDAVGLRANGTEREVVLSNGEIIRAKTVLLCPGIAYRRLGIDAIDRLVGMGVFYGTAVSEAQAMRGKHVYIVGAGNSAGQAALHLARYAAQVTMLVRGPSMARSMSSYLIQEVAAMRRIQVRVNTAVIDGRGEHILEGLVLQNTLTGALEEVEAGALFILIGGEPYTAWLPPVIQRDRQGYILTGRDLAMGGGSPDAWSLARAPLLLETSVPGVFAAGDARHGAPKRIASAVGEGSVAIRNAHEYLAELETGHVPVTEAV
jgi:thioredoxin reductase (NADPH)